jgi:hypothetical protein
VRFGFGFPFLELCSSLPTGGDWALGRVAALFFYGVEQVTIDSCTFEKLDGNAILINGYARGVVIQKNDFHEIGDNIIAQLGETKGAGDIAWGMGWDGTDGNQPRGTIVRHNIAYRCGLFEKQSSFYFQAKSMENIILGIETHEHFSVSIASLAHFYPLLAGNIFFHGPRAGINFNDGFGGGSLLESNLMFATVMESGDHGAPTARSLLQPPRRCAAMYCTGAAAVFALR